jgi:hypothetical protein
MLRQQPLNSFSFANISFKASSWRRSWKAFGQMPSSKDHATPYGKHDGDGADSAFFFDGCSMGVIENQESA